MASYTRRKLHRTCHSNGSHSSDLSGTIGLSKDQIWIYMLWGASVFLQVVGSLEVATASQSCKQTMYINNSSQTNWIDLMRNGLVCKKFCGYEWRLEVSRTISLTLYWLFQPAVYSKKELCKCRAAGITSVLLELIGVTGRTDEGWFRGNFRSP